MNITEMETMMRAAVTKARADGWKILPSCVRIQRENKTCCPLGALGIDSDAILFGTPARKAGLSDDQIRGFWLGFDDWSVDGYADRGAFQLGQQFRRELL